MIIIALIVHLVLCVFSTFTSSFILCHHTNRNHDRQQRLVLQTTSYIIRNNIFEQRSNFGFTLSSTLDDENNVDNDEDEKIFASNMNIDNDIDGQKDIMSEIAWRAKRIDLEEAKDRAFKKALKSRPWKLPYDDAKIWVQKNLGAATKEEFNDLVENGNLRTPYIPKNPEKYYSESGTWISWNNFLKE